MHFGTLFVAVASYLDARKHNGLWLVRIDDLDQPRVSKQAEDSILRSLQSHGLNWDGSISRQQDNWHLYREALDRLEDACNVFYCTCSRNQVDRQIGCVGSCSVNTTRPNQAHSLRMHVDLDNIELCDRIQGSMSPYKPTQARNIALWRRDGIPSYPLSVVVDDKNDGVSDVVRGSDLIENSFQQAYIARSLDLPAPRYAHVPVLTERSGNKLSKRDLATSIDDRCAKYNLIWSMQLLGMEPPQRLSLAELLEWGVKAWNIDSVPKQDHLKSCISI